MSSINAQIIKARAKLAALESKQRAENAAKLKTIPAAYGYSDLNEFIRDLRISYGAPLAGRKPASAVTPAATTEATKPPAKKKTSSKNPGSKQGGRTPIPDSVKEEVKKLAAEGKTAAEISNAIGKSEGMVQYLKKELGLVKARKKRK